MIILIFREVIDINKKKMHQKSVIFVITDIFRQDF